MIEEKWIELTASEAAEVLASWAGRRMGPGDYRAVFTCDSDAGLTSVRITKIARDSSGPEDRP